MKQKCSLHGFLCSTSSGKEGRADCGRATRSRHSWNTLLTGTSPMAVVEVVVVEIVVVVVVAAVVVAAAAGVFTV